MSKKKSSKKSIKKLHLDKPTSHGGWPDGHSGSYRDPNTPVNKQISKFLSDMGLLDDDNPRARLSEDKIRVKRIVLEGLLRKILQESNDIVINGSEIDLPIFLKMFHESNSHSDLQGVGDVFENFFLERVLPKNNYNVNLNTKTKKFPFVDIWSYNETDKKDLTNFESLLNLEKQEIRIPGNFYQVRTQRTPLTIADRDVGLKSHLKAGSTFFESFVDYVSPEFNENFKPLKSFYDDGVLSCVISFNYVLINIDLLDTIKIKNIKFKDENIKKLEDYVFLNALYYKIRHDALIYYYKAKKKEVSYPYKGINSPTLKNAFSTANKNENISKTSEYQKLVKVFGNNGINKNELKEKIANSSLEKVLRFSVFEEITRKSTEGLTYLDKGAKLLADLKKEFKDVYTFTISKTNLFKEKIDEILLNSKIKEKYDELIVAEIKKAEKKKNKRKVQTSTNKKIISELINDKLMNSYSVIGGKNYVFNKITLEDGSVVDMGMPSLEILPKWVALSNLIEGGEIEYSNIDNEINLKISMFPSNVIFNKSNTAYKISVSDISEKENSLEVKIDNLGKRKFLLYHLIGKNQLSFINSAQLSQKMSVTESSLLNLSNNIVDTLICGEKTYTLKEVKSFYSKVIDNLSDFIDTSTKIIKSLGFLSEFENDLSQQKLTLILSLMGLQGNTNPQSEVSQLKKQLFSIIKDYNTFLLKKEAEYKESENEEISNIDYLKKEFFLEEKELFVKLIKEHEDLLGEKIISENINVDSFLDIEVIILNNLLKLILRNFSFEFLDKYRERSNIQLNYPIRIFKEKLANYENSSYKVFDMSLLNMSNREFDDYTGETNQDKSEILGLTPQDNNEPDDLPNVEDDEDIIDITALRRQQDDTEEEDEDEQMVAESKIYRMVLKDLFKHLNR